MQGRSRKVSLAAAVVLSLASALTIATAGTAGATPPDLSTDALIVAYLGEIGVTPGTAVWQGTTAAPSHKNYAGPSCPGTGWNCVPATAPIVQITDAGGTNLFACGGLDCVVVQVALNGGQNGGACVRGDNTSNSQEQVCEITQANDGSPNSTNSATISQNIQQSGASPQHARQVARITQSNTLGRNIARINQVIGQRQDAKNATTITQSQDAHQGATIDQMTTPPIEDPLATAGSNNSDVTQRQDQSQSARKGSTSITQKQNTEPGTPDDVCDRPFVTPYDQDKNQCIEVTQNSSLATGGTGDSALRQVINESQTASNAGSVDQDQGQFAGVPFTGGQLGTVIQNSSAPVNSEASEAMVQTQTATGVSAGVMPGDQFKSTGDPRCCATQTSNENSTADITQTTNQSASSGDDAAQFALLQGECTTTGSCDVTQSATVNGDTTPNSCTDENSCFVTIDCAFVGGEGGECIATSGEID